MATTENLSEVRLTCFYFFIRRVNLPFLQASIKKDKFKCFSGFVSAF